MDLHLHTREKLSTYGLLTVLVVAFGAFLFGYNCSVISGALGFLEQTFSLGPFQAGMVVSFLLLGAGLGSLFGGLLCDRFGRKRTIIITALVFTLGAALVATAANLEMILFGRFLTGLGVGFVFLVGPLYLAEIAPPHLRGSIVAVFQLIGVIGILMGYVINYLFFDAGNWRAMFAVSMIPSSIIMFAMCAFPETPEWLLAHGKIEKAKHVLQRIRQDKLWESHLGEMKKSASPANDASWHRLLQPSVKFALFIGIMLNVFQQIVGINAVIYFAPKIFGEAGFGSGSASIVPTLGIGLINVLMTFVALQLLDRVGRRPLLLTGVIGIVVSLLLFTVTFFLDVPAKGIIAVITLISYVGFFALSLGPIPGLIVAEIYPLSVRGRAMSLALAANWIFNFLVAQTFLPLVAILKVEGVFLLFAIISIFAFFFIKRFVPETKGKSLEQIELSMAALKMKK